MLASLVKPRIPFFQFDAMACPVYTYGMWPARAAVAPDSRGGTMAGMATKKKHGNGRGRKPAYTLFVRISPQLGAAFEGYVAATEPRPSRTSVLELALREYLTRRGVWPPGGRPDGGPPG